jgi:hypothetical protein
MLVLAFIKPVICVRLIECKILVCGHPPENFFVKNTYPLPHLVERKYSLQK